MKLFNILLSAALLSAPAPAFADRLIEDVKGVTWTRAGEIKRFTALLLTDDGKVKAYLGEKDKRPKKVTFYYDANGAVLIPGFTDAAVDMGAFSIASLGLDLTDAAGPSGVLSALGRFAADGPDRRWLLGYGWRGAWEAMPLTAADLDMVEAERPVLLLSADGGMGLANSAALARLELAGNGRLTEEDLAIAKARLPVPSGAERDLAFLTAQDRLLGAGVTAISDLGTHIALWQTYRRAGDEGRLWLRINGFADGTAEMTMIAGSRPTPWLYGERLRLSGLAATLDGPLTGRQAWLSAPYQDGNKRTSRMTDAELRNTIVRAAMDGFAVAIIAHGDAAVAEALFAFEDVGGSFPAQKDWRVVGADMLDDTALAKTKGRHVTMQSALPATFPAFAADLPPESLRQLSRMNGAFANGTLLSLGSMATGGAPSPFIGLAALLDRADPAGAMERPARMAALVAMTHTAAEASGMAGFTGGLAIGQWADFILVDVDPTVAMPDELRRARVSQTWIGGQRVWEAKDSAPAAADAR